MGNQLLASKITVEEEQPQVRTIAQQATSVAGAVMVTQKGPIGVATRVTSAEEFLNVFGSHSVGSLAPLVVRGFFENGGTELWVVRTVHYADPATPASKTSTLATKTITTVDLAAGSGQATSAAGNFDLEPAQTLIVAVDADPDDTATFDAAAGYSDSGAGPTFVLVNGTNLTLKVDGGAVQTVTFATAQFVNIGAATLAEIAAVINGQISGASAAAVVGGKVRIISDVRGTSSGINITGGTANGVLGYTPGNVAGSGDVANINSVTPAEAIAVINADISALTATIVGGAVVLTSNTTGAASKIHVKNTSTAVGFGFDNAAHMGIAAGAVNTLRIDAKYDGTYANDLSAKVSAATNGETDSFNVEVIDSTGLVLETYPNVSMADTSDRFVETVLADSTRVAAVDLDAAVTSPYDRPANGTFALTGGGDGLVGLVDADYIGTQAGDTGLYAFDLVDDLTILFVPGVATAAVQSAMLSYCEVHRLGQVFAILDPPAGQTAAQAVTYVVTTAALVNLSGSGAFYWPRIKTLNSSESVYGAGESVVVPPSGHIAGVFCRTDSARDGGVYDQPAGTEEGKLFDCVGFETDEVLKESARDLVFPKRINPLTTKSGQPRFVDGARTLKGDGNWPSVAQRRGVSAIETSIRRGIEWARHKKNDSDLRARLTRTVRAYLRSQMALGAFATKVEATAFWVDFGDALNPPSQKNKVVGRIGLATSEPAEFIVIKVSEDTRALDQELAQ